MVGDASSGELAEVVTRFAAELADLRVEVRNARRALDAALTDAEDLRRERDRLLELVVRQEAWLTQAGQSGAQPRTHSGEQTERPERRRAGKLRLFTRRFGGALRRQALASPPVQPAAIPPFQPAARVASLMPFSRDGAEPRPLLFAAVIGLVPAELDRVVALAQRQAEKAGVHVVFLTDCSELTLFRRYKALVEYLPPAGDLAGMADPAEVQLYLARRLGLLRRKWRPVRVLAYGRDALVWLETLTALPDAVDLRGLFTAEDRPQGAADATMA
ncbi:hypothetical protein N825_34080 [Skermanella stibiiresistens SB22]|uniref:Uncharacterized protein n=1 Tax=Skermanella stibiiresistens SB22 TaxID=1385369 RepID=W9GWH6_9PROT|nr:hypothetical protein [Skermanella stibiiresistens]EWY35843.1 hypothetical protein N825_34080 [Skermanella stibiiresistens SB22]